jgi:anaerobic selenocysteine-containing dehydrogenase
MEPLAEALPNQEIFRRLAAAMGFREPELYESDEAMIATLLEQSGLGLDFASLASSGTVEYTTEPVIPFAHGVFPTPSGKVEIAGERFVAEGLPRAPQPWADPRPADGRLRLLSPASRWFMNSSYSNVPKLQKRAGAQVFLHPQEADARGLADGAKIILANEAGQLPLCVTLCEDVPRGVALVHKGRWPKLDPAGANVNLLNAGPCTDLARSSAVHSVEVEIRPAATT